MKQDASILLKRTTMLGMVDGSFGVKIAVFVSLLLFPIIVEAQFININIDIPAKTGVSEMEYSEPIWKPDNNPVIRDMESTYKLTLSSSENLLVMASISHSDFMKNENGDLVKMSATLAFQNDGITKPKRADKTDMVIFPMSNSGLLIENMKGDHQNLNAYIIIYTSAEMPQHANGLFIGEISLKIEYN